MLVFIQIVSSSGDHLVIKTSTGRVRGTVIDKYCLPVFAWLGIPYASPPVRDLRFKPPVPVVPWENIYDARHKSKSCYQSVIDFPNNYGLLNLDPNSMSEDCLYLNILAPLADKSCHNDKLPVIVYIHGTDFQQGSTAMRMYDLHGLVTYGDVIVVAMNYRVGSLGFLRIDDDTVAGNMGLLDQQFALKWIKENIELFGGDPEKITLMGDGAGSISISLHLLSDNSKGLFNRVIMHSGVALSNLNFHDQTVALNFSKTLGTQLGCNNVEDNTALLDCLQNADAASLTKRISQTIYPFVPTIDGTFIKGDPKNLTAQKSFCGIDVLIGNNENEGDLEAYELLRLFDILPVEKIPQCVTKEMVLSVLEKLYIKFGVRSSIASEIIEYYAEKANYNYFKVLADLIGDYDLNCPINTFSKMLYINGAHVYKFVFTHETNQTTVKSKDGFLSNEDIFYVLGAPFQCDFPKKFTSDEHRLSLAMIHLWSQFARFGKPDDNWVPYSLEHQEYALLGIHHPEMRCGWRNDNCFEISTIMTVGYRFQN